MTSDFRIKVPGDIPAGHRVSGPAGNEIHLWGIRLDASPEFASRCRETLRGKEAERIDFFKFQNSRDSYMLSQGGLRLLLSAYLGKDPVQLSIGRHPKGKPFSLDEPGLHFNMSNSGKWVVYAFGTSELGIDLEYIRPLEDLEDLIRRNFTDREIFYINRLEKEKQKRFFKFWTVKEAYLKAIGEGMRLPPENLSFQVDKGGFRLESVKGVFEADEWRFSDFQPDSQHTGTVAHQLEMPIFIKMNF